MLIASDPSVSEWAVFADPVVATAIRDGQVGACARMATQSHPSSAHYLAFTAYHDAIGQSPARLSASVDTNSPDCTAKPMACHSGATH